ncbi:unnamed protein product [Diatraea saccharalis]|uniref:HAUS augmin-like complex subunit 6 N-terminal domain-containing protein n=1 Tax=Diatraea saccharalis TaxID=40085 RepID=A0A9N9WIS2_9NEOP|nr:unnamed protein product [Diatraea saccharalis]
MATITNQKDLVVNLKRETFLNVRVLSKLRPMPIELSRLVLKENAVEKPTQNLFNHLSYYLVAIIDVQVADKFSWPLYDSKSEKLFRSQLSVFINDYSAKGLLSPVMSSYLVNPGCYKVIMLMFQMSQLAVQRVLVAKIVKDDKKVLYRTVTEKYNCESGDIFEDTNKEVKVVVKKLSDYQKKRCAMEKIASVFTERIVSMEKTISSLNAQKFIDDLVDNYINKNSLDEATKTEISDIKNVQRPAPFFDNWLHYVDGTVKEMVSKWGEKVAPMLKVCTECERNTAALIGRYTGEADRSSYVVEYNHTTDEMCTSELENQVNSQQKYILKNIVKNEVLYFPNLIKSYLISVCFILKNNEIGHEIYKFNEYLETGNRNYSELVSALKMLNNRILNTEAKLQPSRLPFAQSVTLKEFGIPPLPDLTGLKANKESTGQILFDTFTPLRMSKHQFNLRRKNNSFSFSKPELKPLITPFCQAPRDNFFNSLISCRISNYDRPNVSTNFNNISMISQANSRGNDTIAECSAGFTKQQIMRLLSTKKSSSSKKFKYSIERPNINVKKGGLFNESNVSNENYALYRSHSSPDLFENRERKCFVKGSRRKLSVMQEDSPSLLEVSGIAALEKDDTYGTPDGVVGLENSRKLIDAASLPVINILQEQEKRVEKVFNEIEEDLTSFKSPTYLNKIEHECPELKPVLNEPRRSFDIKDESKTETPKTNAQLIRKTSSLERIITRFKKVRANVLPAEGKDGDGEITTIDEEKENCNAVNKDAFTADKILLPDLLSPSCSVLSIKSTDNLDQLCMDMDGIESRKPRQSLGTALGVDKTILDQFDLID